MDIRWFHSHRTLVASLVGAILAVGLLSILVIRQQQGQASQVYLEAGGSVGANPFVPLVSTPSVEDGNLGGGGTSYPTAAGTEGRATYDSEKLISYLGSHPQAAAAWVKALNSDPTLSWSGGNRVEVQQIPAYVHELTPRNLGEDLRVTDYQYVNGAALAVQSILEKGTIVLVDAKGVSRVRCASGNPLGLMIQMKTNPTYRGTRWPGFQPQRVIVVQRGAQCDRDEYYDGEHCRRIAGCPRDTYLGNEGRCFAPRQVASPDDSGRSTQPDKDGQLDEVKQPDGVGPSDQPTQSDKGGRPDGGERPENIGRPDESTRPDNVGRRGGSTRPDNVGSSDQPTQSDKNGRPNEAKRPEHLGPSNQSARPNKDGRSDEVKRPDNVGPSDQPAQSDKGGRQNERKRSDNAGRPDEPTRPANIGPSDQAKQPREDGHPDQVKRPDKGGSSGHPGRPNNGEQVGQSGKNAPCTSGTVSRNGKCVPDRECHGASSSGDESCQSSSSTGPKD